MNTNSLDGIKIKPGEKISIDVTFKLTKATDSQGVQDAIRMEGIDSQKSNIVEISNYSTFYGDSGKIAGKIDKDSAPDNVNLSVSVLLLNPVISCTDFPPSFSNALSVGQMKSYSL